MPREYRIGSDEAQEIAHDLQNKHHTHLSTQRVEVVFLTEAAKSKGRDLWGRSRVVSGLPAFFASYDVNSKEPFKPQSFFVIEISESIWNAITIEQKRALLDHCLSFCEVHESEKGTALKIVSPDVAEFGAVIERNGLWYEEIQKFAEIAAGAQGKLFDQPKARKLRVAAD
jgi:hypothetical protein